MRNSDYNDEKENLLTGSKTKKRNTTGSSTIINTILNSECSKNIFKTNNKRKYRDIDSPKVLVPLHYKGEDYSNSNINGNNMNLPSKVTSAFKEPLSEISCSKMEGLDNEINIKNSSNDSGMCNMNEN